MDRIEELCEQFIESNKCDENTSIMIRCFLEYIIYKSKEICTCQHSRGNINYVCMDCGKEIEKSRFK